MLDPTTATVKQGRLNVLKAFRRDVPQLTPIQGDTMYGAHSKDNAYLRQVDGVPLRASSGSIAMDIDSPGNTGNNMTNQFYKEPWSLDDLFDGGGAVLIG